MLFSSRVFSFGFGFVFLEKNKTQSWEEWPILQSALWPFERTVTGWRDGQIRTFKKSTKAAGKD